MRVEMEEEVDVEMEEVTDLQVLMGKFLKLMVWILGFSLPSTWKREAVPLVPATWGGWG